MMPTPDLIDAAARCYRAGNFAAARQHLDEAIAAPDAADHAKRIRSGKDLLVLVGAYDRVWVPQVAHWRRCQALDNACPQADAECKDECRLVAAGWPTEAGGCLILVDGEEMA